MILAVSRPQQLNGSRLILLLSILCYSIFSCATKKSSVQQHQNKVNHPNTTATHQLPSKVDTAVWKKYEEKPVKTPDKADATTKPERKYTKPDDHFEILCMLPFKTASNDSLGSEINSSSLRFVQYYAGMSMAMDELNNEGGKKINFNVKDAESVTEIAEVLSLFNNSPPHLIIGPQKAEALKYAADWAKSHETSLLSPWVSSSTITENNPYYIQTKAGISSHYAKLNEHARAHYPAESIMIISRSPEESRSRYFNDNIKFRDSIEEKFIKESDLATGVDPVVGPLLKATGPTVFILPYFSSKDENYIYHFLRRMVSEKNNKEVIVYGTSKWLEMKSEIIDFMNIYNIRISISNFFDQDNSAIRSFKKKYFDTYREFPSQDAMEGYDLVKYAIKSLRQYGPDFQWKSNSSCNGLLETSFEFQPVYKNKSADRKSGVDYYENSFLRVVEIKSNRYRIID